MLDMHWEVKTFPQLETERLFDVLELRVNVFVVEQQCAYPELDAYDRHADTRHLSGTDAMGQLMAYARILPPGLRYPEVSLGRFVVRREARGKGLGHQLMCEALKEVQKSWPEGAVRISAQAYLQNFYEQYGFLRLSDVYLEDGVPHIEMVRKC
jgi:ElaA protein